MVLKSNLSICYRKREDGIGELLLFILDRVCVGLFVKYGFGFFFLMSLVLILKGLYNRELFWYCSFVLFFGYDEVGEYFLVLWYILFFDCMV